MGSTGVSFSVDWCSILEQAGGVGERRLGYTEPMPDPNGGRLLNAGETRRLAGLGWAEWLRLCEYDGFPRPRRQGAKIVWRAVEVREWLDRSAEQERGDAFIEALGHMLRSPP